MNTLHIIKPSTIVTQRNIGDIECRNEAMDVENTLDYKDIILQL